MNVLDQTHAPETTRRPKHNPTPHAVTLGLFDAEIMQMRRDGNSTLWIGAQLGCSRETVKRRLAAIQAGNIAPRRSRRPRHAVTLGLHDAELLRLRADGNNPVRIGMMLGCSDGTVLNRLAALRAAGEAKHG